jgi:hypothetical protein
MSNNITEFDISERVAIVSHSHPSLSKGGAENAAYTLFQGLRSLGVDAILIAACPINYKDQFNPDSVYEYPIYYESQSYSHFYQISEPGVYRQLATLLTKLDVQVVNFHHYLNLGINSLSNVKRLLNLKCFLTLHEFLAICPNHGQMVTRPLKNLCFKATTADCAKCFPERGIPVVTTRRLRMYEALSSFNGFISPSQFLSERYI